MDSIHTFRNNQSWGFELIDQIYIGEKTGTTEHIYAGDINGDNYPELLVTGYKNPTKSHTRLLWNDGTGHFIDTNSVYVSQKEIRLKQTIDVFPNPTTSALFIKLRHPFSNNQNLEINIYSSLGKLVQSQEAKFSGESLQINVNGLAPGIYLLELSGKDFRETGRFVKS